MADNSESLVSRGDVNSARMARGTKLKDRRVGVKLFTTGAIASLLQVAPRTVSKWFDSGRLRGYRVSGDMNGGDRRVTLENLQQFARKYGIRLPYPYSGEAHLVCIGLATTVPIKSSIQITAAYYPTLVSGLVGIDYAASSHVIVINGLTGCRSDILEAGRALRKKLEHCILIVLPTEDDSQPMDYLASGYNEVILQPSSDKKVRASINRHLEGT